VADYTGSFSGSFTGSLLSTNGVISSSAQVVGSLPTGVISGSDQLPSGLISSSAQLPSGLISSSVQVVPTDLTIDYFNLSNLPVTITPFQANSILANSALRNNFATNVKTRLNAENVLSGSAQITDVITDSYISASAAASGFGSDLPDGTISSSAQISALGYITRAEETNKLTISGQTLSISNGNSVFLPQAGVGSGASIWNTGSQDPNTYQYLMTQNNLQVTGSFDIQGDLTVNGKSVFIQDVGTDAGLAVEVQGRMKILEKELAGYIASASIQIGGTKDSIDCGGFF